MRSDLAKGSISGAAQVVITSLLVLVAVPLFVRLRGDEAFGLYSLIALVGSVNTFANLGLNMALVRFLSEQGKCRESDIDIVVTLLMLLVAIVPFTIAGFVFEDAALRYILNVPAHLHGDASWLYRGTLISNVFVLLGGTFTAVLDAQGRVYVTNLLQVLYTVLYWGAILGVLIAGLPLGVIGGVTLVATLVWFAGAGAGMVRWWGVPSITGLAEIGFDRARRQLGYGVHLFTAGVVGFFSEPLTKLLLSHFLGLREVGIFDIGMRARNLVSSLALKVMYPLYPYFARTSDPDQLRTLVRDVEQKAAYLVAPLPGIAALMTAPVVGLVFGMPNEKIALTMVWMVSAYLLMSFTVTPVYMFLMARGYAARTVLVQLLNVVANGAAFLLTFGWLGYWAVIAGALASAASSCILLLVYQRKFVGAMVFETWSRRWAFGLVLAGGVGIGIAAPAVVGTALAIVGGTITIIAFTVLMYRSLGVFAARDLERYLGTTSAASRLVVRVLCQGAGPTVTAGRA